MAVKFSQFNVETDVANVGYLVGYDGTDNVQITPANLIASSSIIDGSGTAQKIPKWVDAETLTDSIMTEDPTGPTISVAGNIDLTGTLTGTTATFVKDQNADSIIQLYNANAGAAAQATIYVGNSSAAADGLFLGANGTGMTTAGGFVQDGAAIGSGTGASGGLSIMTRAAADMRFYTNGHTNERMRIESGGDVGIGTDSPNPFSWGNRHLTVEAAGTNQYAALDLVGSGNGGGAIIFGGGDGSGTATNIGRAQISAIDGSHLTFNTNASNSGASFTERMRITSGGNVGIGTDAPTNLLTINDPNANGSITDTIPSWWGLVIDRAYTTSSTAAMALIGGTVATGSSGRLYLGNSDDVDNTYIDGGADQLHFNVGGERMRINSSGNLGLGTTIIRQRFHQHVATSSENYHVFTNTDTGTGASDGFVIGINAGEEALIWNQENTDMVFATNNAEKMRLDNGGDLTVIASYSGSTFPFRVGYGTYASFTPTFAIADTGNVKIGTATTGTPAVNADDLVIDNGATEAGITLMSTSASSLRFGDAADTSIGYIEYAHTNTMSFGVSGATAMSIDSAHEMRLNYFTATKGYSYISDESSTGSARLFLKANATGNAIMSWVSLLDSGNVERGYVGFGSSGNSNIYLYNQLADVYIYAGGQSALRCDSGASATATAVHVYGTLSKNAGSFRIKHPHPSKKDTHDLVHSFIEGSQADLIYRGKVNLINGKATVNIDNEAGMTDGTFVLLNTNVQCFTSNESDWDAVKGKVEGNVLTIECQNSSSAATISWMVIGERCDEAIKETTLTDDEGKVIVEPKQQEESEYNHIENI